MKTIWLIAYGTFSSAVRRRILNIFLAVGLVLIALGFSTTSFHKDQDLTIIRSVGLGVIGIAGVFISVIVGISLVPEEIERRTVYMLLSKPMQRYQFLCGKFFGGLFTVFANVAFLGIAFLILMQIKQHRFSFDIFHGIVLIFFQLVLVVAISVFFSVFLSPFVNFFLTFSVYLLGTLSSVTQSLASNTDGKKNALVTAFFKAMYIVIPNFGNYNIQNPLIHPDVKITNEMAYMTQNILYAIVYAAILMTIATLIFEKREV